MISPARLRQSGGDLRLRIADFSDPINERFFSIYTTVDPEFSLP